MVRTRTAGVCVCVCVWYFMCVHECCVLSVPCVVGTCLGVDCYQV